VCKISRFFIDNSSAVKQAIEQAIQNGLEECGGEIESQVKSNTRVDNSDLKNSWYHKTEGDSCVIGSPLENATWEEFGTGIYGNGGRQTPWKYEYKGKKGRNGWRTTKGKKKNPHGLKNTAFGMKKELETHMQDILKEYLK
jgi:hypothetical protein